MAKLEFLAPSSLAFRAPDSSDGCLQWLSAIETVKLCGYLYEVRSSLALATAIRRKESQPLYYIIAFALFNESPATLTHLLRRPGTLNGWNRT